MPSRFGKGWVKVSFATHCDSAWGCPNLAAACSVAASVGLSAVPRDPSLEAAMCRTKALDYGSTSFATLVGGT